MEVNNTNIFVFRDKKYHRFVITCLWTDVWDVRVEDILILNGWQLCTQFTFPLRRLIFINPQIIFIEINVFKIVKLQITMLLKSLRFLLTSVGLSVESAQECLPLRAMVERGRLVISNWRSILYVCIRAPQGSPEISEQGAVNHDGNMQLSREGTITHFLDLVYP